MTYYFERDTHCVTSAGLKFLGFSNPLALAFWVLGLQVCTTVLGYCTWLYRAVFVFHNWIHFYFALVSWEVLFDVFHTFLSLTSLQFFFYCFMNAGLNFISCSTVSVQITIWFSTINEIEYVTVYSTIDPSFPSWKRLSLVMVLFYSAKLPDSVCQNCVHEWDWPSVSPSKAALA